MKLYTKKHRHIHGICKYWYDMDTGVYIYIYILLLVGVGNDSLVLHEF